MPSKGMKRDIYLNSKFGSKDNARSVYQKIEDEGKLENIYFQFGKIKITPNSFLSHKLLAYAYSKKNKIKFWNHCFINILLKEMI